MDAAAGILYVYTYIHTYTHTHTQYACIEVLHVQAHARALPLLSRYSRRRGFEFRVLGLGFRVSALASRSRRRHGNIIVCVHVSNACT